MPKKPKKSPYKVLDVPESADHATIKRAYRKKASESHPDKEAGSHDSMAEINAAWETLGNPARKLLYDQTGQEKQSRPEEEARNVLLQVFNTLLQTNEDLDYVKTADKFLAHKISEINSERQGLLSAEKKLTAKRAKVSVKTGENLFHEIIDNQLKQIRWTLEETARNIQACTLARKLLETYELTEPVPDGQFMIVFGTKPGGWL